MKTGVLLLAGCFCGKTLGTDVLNVDTPPLHQDDPAHPPMEMDELPPPDLEDVGLAPVAIPGMQVDWVRQFPKIDVDRDGGATAEELIKFLEHSHATLSKAEHADILAATIVRQEGEFAHLDTNQDGLVDLVELWVGKDQGGAVTASIEGKRKEQFDFADGDSDGVLGPEEYAILTHPDFSPNKAAAYAQIAQVKMDFMDENGDGDVTVAEYEAAKARERDAFEADTGMSHTAAEVADIKVMEEAHFKIADADADGRITLAELAARETSSSEFQAEVEARELLQHLDTSDPPDGKVSLAEFEAGFHNAQPHLHQFFAERDEL